MGLLGRKRARTADRDKAVEAVNDAYAQGQLTDAEREDRVHRALVAVSLGDLAQVTADLQPEPAKESDSAPQRERQNWWQRSSSRTGLALGAAALVLVGGVVAAVQSGGDDPVQVDDAPYFVPVDVDGFADLYGDGQISLEEYEERAAGVRAADNAWRLERWTNDLQLPPPPTPARRWWESLRTDWRSYSRRTKIVLVSITLAWVVPGVGLVVYDAVRDPGQDASTVSEQGLSSGLGELREAFEAEFGTTVVGRLQIDPGLARVQVLVEDDPPRFQDWLWQDGSFAQQGATRGGQPGTVDLADVDVAAVEATLRGVATGLGVAEVSRVTTIIWPRTTAQTSDGGERISFVLRNDFGETARLTTDLAGRELSRDRFVSPQED